MINTSRTAAIKDTADLGNASVSSDEHDLEVVERKSSNTLGNPTNRQTELDNERANTAQESHCAAGHPSDRVKQMLDNRKFKDRSLTGHEVDNSNALDSYPHIKEFLIPYKTGEKKKPNTYGDINAYDSFGRCSVHDDLHESQQKFSIETMAATTAVNHGKKRHSEKRVTCQFCGKLGHSAKQCLVLAKTSEPKSMDRQHNDYESMKSPRDYFKNSGISIDPISKSCTADETCSHLWSNLSAEDNITDNFVQSSEDNPILAADADISIGESILIKHSFSESVP